MTEDLEHQITQLQQAAAKQGDVVRSLKAQAKDGKAEKARSQRARRGRRYWNSSFPSSLCFS